LYRIKPAVVGQTYLIDITIGVEPNALAPKVFRVATPDTGTVKSENTIGFSSTGVQHVLLTFTAKNTNRPHGHACRARRNGGSH
jgi:hypothetical protein